jgi:hypothetical protein
MNITGRASFQPENNTLLGAFLASTTGGVGIAGGGSKFYGGATEFDASRSWTGETSSVGNNQPHNNMPPYEVAYCWKRIA